MANGLSTLSIFNPLMRNQLQDAAASNVYTSTYEQTCTVGPTRENLAKLQNEQAISDLADEIAAAESPEAVKAREEKNYFARTAEERQLQEKKDAMQKKVDDNALEMCVKADKYFLITKQWDRWVIMAANGETVTVEYEDTTAEKTNEDGSYPTVTLEIKKSSKLKSLAARKGDKKSKTSSQILNEGESKKSALKKKYSINDNGEVSIDQMPTYDEEYEELDNEQSYVMYMIESGEDTGNDAVDEIDADNTELRRETAESYYSAKFTALDEKNTAYVQQAKAEMYKKYTEELKKLEEDIDKELATIKESSSSPPAQGLNIEPHTIAIYAPGFCMEEGCCLENAFYTLRATAKQIEDDAEGEAKLELKDMYDKLSAYQTELATLKSDLAKAETTARSNAARAASKDYQTAYKKSLLLVKAGGSVTVTSTPKPDPTKYTADVYLEKDKSYRKDAGVDDLKEKIEAQEKKIATYEPEVTAKKEEVMKQLLQDAKNYRLLLDHCSFQPTCPEWLEDAATATLDGLKAAGEAMLDAFEWTGEALVSGITAIGDGISDGLAYLGELQDDLAELVGFKGLCSLNPFGGTLGCRNCPMGSSCSSQEKGLLAKIKDATNNNNFLNNLKRALGLGKGQLLGNLLQCVAALSGEVLGAVGSVASFAVSSGMPSVLAPAAAATGLNKLPIYNTTMGTCLSNVATLSEAKSALNTLNSTAKGPMSMLKSNVPGMGDIGVDLNKLDYINSTSSYFSKGALGANKLQAVEAASKVLDVETPSGSTRFYDGKFIDVDSSIKQMETYQKKGIAYA